MNTLPQEFFENLTPKGTSPTSFFGKLFEIRDTLHLAHLEAASKSYAEHIALGDLYGSITDFADTIIESHFGLYGPQAITIPKTSSTAPIPYLQATYKWIDSNRSMFKETFIQNVIDEIQQNIAQTLYKLKNLK